jgi:prevent-host-death family protein
MPNRTDMLDLDVDLEGGVVPISKAASSLAALLKRAREKRQPIIVTQKGYPTGVLLDVELYTALRALAAASSTPQDAPAESAAPVPEPEALPPTIAEPEPAPARRGGRRRKAQGDT